MSPELLKLEIKRAFGGLSPAELGKQLRADYEECVRGFWDIIAATGPTRRSGDGSRTTPIINLGVYSDRDGQQARCGAVVRATTNGVMGAGRSETRVPYGVEVRFYGSTGEGVQKHLKTELFGSGGYNFLGMRPPAFIRDPGCSSDGSWPPEAEDYHYGIGGDYPWDAVNYPEVQSRLRPMIETARQTQRLLIGAMQDGRLNPQFHEAASGLLVPGDTERVIV